jgi:hypothetical protein
MHDGDKIELAKLIAINSKVAQKLSAQMKADR